MTIAMSSAFSLVLGDENPNSPLVGYHNVITSTNIAATSSNASYPVSNLANPSTAPLQEWRGTSAVLHYLTATLSGSVEVDYVAVAAHNFGSKQMQISVEANIGAGWVQVADALLLPTDSPLIVRFTPDYYTGVRLKLGAGTAAPRCAVMYVGKLLPLQRNIYVGHTPITLARKRNVVTGQNEEASFLGRITLGGFASNGVSLQNLTPGWYRSKMHPFIQAAESTPFFFAWRPQGYPREVGFAWFTGELPVPKNQRSNGMMQVDFNMRAMI